MIIFSIVFLLFIKDISYTQEKVKSITLREICSIGGNDSSSFVQVGDVACDSKSNIYVTDQYQYKVKKFNSRGKFLSEFGHRGKKQGEFQGGPSKIICIGDTIAIVDLGTTKVLFFTVNFNILTEIKVASPIVDIAFDKHGGLYASMIPVQNEENIIKLYDRTRNTVSNIPAYKFTEDPFFNIAPSCVDVNDNLIVAYSYVNRVIVYNDKHEILTQFRIEGLPDQSVANKLEGVKFGSMPEGEIFRDIAVDKKGYIYILGGFYSKNTNRDVYVVNHHGDIQTTLVLPYESGMLYLDHQGFLYTREQKRTIVKKYAPIYINF